MPDTYFEVIVPFDEYAAFAEFIANIGGEITAEYEVID